MDGPRIGESGHVPGLVELDRCLNELTGPIRRRVGDDTVRNQSNESGKRGEWTGLRSLVAGLLGATGTSVLSVIH
jgi:hypothetical protein